MAVGRASAITSLSEYHEPVNALIYGDPGDGKTALLATAPKALFLNCDPGIVTAERRGSKADVWPIRHWQDGTESFIKAIEWLEQNHSRYENICIEGLTVLQDMLLRNIVEKWHQQNPTRRSDIIPAQDNYLEQQLRLTQAINRLNAIPVNKWYTAHVMRTDSEEGEDLWLPLIHGKNYGIAQKVCAMMGIVAYLWIPDGLSDEAAFENRIRFRKTAPHMSLKSRYEGLPPVMRNPTIPAIMARINTTGGSKTTATKRRPTATTRRSKA